MNVRTYFMISALVALPFGVGFLLAPAFLAGIFGVNLDPGGVLISRFYGALLINIGLLYFLLREMQYTETVRSMTYAHLTGNVLGLIVALMGVLSGTLNSLGWVVVLLYIVLTLLSAYFLFARQAMPVARSSAR